MPFPVMAALGFAKLAFGGLMSSNGDKQMREAEELQRRNIRPKYQASGMYQDLLDYYVNESQYGLDRNARSYATEKINNNYTAGLSAMLQAGGNPNSANTLYSTSADAMENLAIADSDKRWQKVQAVASITDKLGEVKKDEFLYNEDGPYKDRAQLAATKAQMGYNQKMTGKDYMLGTLTQMIGHYGNKAAATTTVDPNVGAGAGGVVSVSSMFRTGTSSNTPRPPATAAGNINNGMTTAETLNALWSGKIKGYDVNGNPIL